ncbi:hypothetical protein HQ587_03895 [bacterium]|nr:hypothetical protein [bacterium]
MDRKHLFFVLAIMFILAAVIGCEEEDSPTSPAPPGLPEELYPIQSSVSWIYDVEAYKNDSLLYRNTDTLTIDKQVIWGSSNWYGLSDEDSIYWRNGVEGVWRLLKDSGYSDGFAEKYYAYPVAAGDKWYVRSDDDSVNVVSIIETVDVPAGVFHGCYYYRFERSNRSRLASVWIKPGVGIVQQSELVFASGDTLESTSKLRKY